nr:prolyl oligopeptidase family serine peptidase [uncultured Pedobacter sp.]
MLLIFGCSNGPKVKLLPAEAFFTGAQQSKYQISPNGKSLAFLQFYKGKLNVFVRSVNDTASVRVTDLKDASVRNLNWVGDNRLLCVKQKDSVNSFSAFLINSDGTNSVTVKSEENTKINILDAVAHDHINVLITLNERDEAFFDVYQLNIRTGEKKLFVKNPGNIVSWFADEAGNVNLGVGGDGVNETIYYRKSSADAFMPVISNNFKNTLKPVGFTKDKRFIYALSNLNRDKLALVEFDCVNGKESKLIYTNPNADILEVLVSRLTNEPISVIYENDKRETHFLDENHRKIYDSILKKLPNQEVEVIAKDSLERNFVVKAYTDKDPGSYYIYKTQQRKLQKIADVNSAINPENMCEMKPVSYKTRDGLTIQGYLTLPLGKSKKNIPCVILPHQGPSQRNVWGYSPEVQFLANRGYAVFQMNFRGSTGYGKAFENAGFKQWGGKMQDDIFDGVQWLISEGIANPQKIGIFGYGFGGYSALNQIVKHPDTYKCCASYSGYINLFNYIKGFPAYFKPYKLMLNEIVGNPETDIDYLKSASPVFQIEKIKTPLFIAQGGKDPKVNVNETSQFVKELRKKGVPVNYILNENETQLFKNNNSKLLFYKQLSDFLDKYLKTE